MSRPAAKRFVPSNPGGRPGRLRGAKMVEYIGKATEDGLLMASYFVRTLKGLEKGVTHLDKRYAATWLADRYAGKAVEVALSGDLADENNPLAELDASELKALIHTIVKRKATAKPPDALPAAENPVADAPQQPTSLQTPENT